MSTRAHPRDYETRIDGPVSARARRAAWLGGGAALHAAERAAVARTHATLARDLVAGIAAARLQAAEAAVAAGPAPAGLARRVRALAVLRARAVTASGG